ncbi:MAG: ATP-binding protein [Planctomycetes bacterium]|nr:ATP-binding protein [Planctomycetota bacterium]
MAKSTGAGAATTGGVNFQNRVAAWFAVQMIAEEEASLPWALPGDCGIASLHAETKQPVDDILAVTTLGGVIFTQSKRTISLSDKADSDLASVFDQFVRQFMAWTSATAGPSPWERKIDVTRDRLVLAVGSAAPKTITQTLRQVLDKLRALPPGHALNQAAASEDETEALRIATAHIKQAWKVARGLDPTDSELLDVLRLCHVAELRLEPGEGEELSCKNALRRTVLESTLQVDAAWGVIQTHCATLAPARSVVHAADMRTVLHSAGLKLKQPRSYADDIECLRSLSEGVLKRLSAHAHLDRPRTAHIKRDFEDLLASAADQGHLLMVGEPGTGKSGAVHELARALVEKKRDVILIAADQVAARSLGELRGEWNLRHDLVDVVAHWEGAEPGFLLVDALDAARDGESERTLRDLLEAVIGTPASRWRVVASVRKFDLRYGDAWQQLFPGEPIPEHADPEFPRVRHVNVAPLSEAELGQLESASPALHEALRDIPGPTRALLRYPFNLHIFSELLEAGVLTPDLEPFRTQRDLLDRYWKLRVVRNDQGSDDRELLLRRACESMLAARALNTPRMTLAAAMVGGTLEELLRAHILMEVETGPGVVDRYRIAFSHHVLFDYATSRLVFETDMESLPQRLRTNPDLAIVARPSLLQCFEALWLAEPNRASFWRITFALLADKGVPETVKALAPSIAARRARSLEELKPLTDRLKRTGA